MAATLLVELLTEELPPKSLPLLAEAFRDQILAGLARHQLVQRGARQARWFATPRRLAVLIPAVESTAPDRTTEIEGPSVKAPAQAVAGFARKQGVEVQALEQRDAPKGKVYLARVHVKGAQLAEVLERIVAEAVQKLPVAKLMRWGAGEAQFVRPVHGLVMLHGSRPIPGSVLGVAASSTTRGHRFMGAASIALASADEYEAKLRDEGSVIADFAARRAEIARQLEAEAKRLGASLGEHADLLDEVTALVEHPSVYAGGFDAAFLEVPAECLVLTMRRNQKYFPLFDAGGKLLPKFLIVSNLRAADPRAIVEGNQRVVRPRLEDARFFYEQDRRTRLEARVPGLAAVTYHRKLGSQRDRVDRLKLLAGRIARELGADAAQAERAAELAKADLLTGMVGEFPELQGIMGRYYARNDGEPAEVADAIEAHYRPRFAGDRLPEGGVACAVALADKLDALAGLFGAGETPTGEKDPFGLRRAALGVIRIVVEHELPLSLHDLVNWAFEGYQKRVGDAHIDVEMFVFERFAGYLKELGYSTLQVESVLSGNPVRLALVPKQLEAVKAFQSLPEAESLAAANKRVANILRQAESKGESYQDVDRKELRDPVELALFDALAKADQAAQRLFEKSDYTNYLKTFAVLKAPVDTFFDKVKVMADDAALRRARLALLADLRKAMNRVADISKLAA